MHTRQVGCSRYVETDRWVDTQRREAGTPTTPSRKIIEPNVLDISPLKKCQRTVQTSITINQQEEKEHRLYDDGRLLNTTLEGRRNTYVSATNGLVRIDGVLQQ